MAGALKAINGGQGLPLADGLTKEREQFARIAASEDAYEGVVSFLEKRPAQFKDK
jgi:enoyl-CoA hydratase/carnithine racemase